MMRILTHLLEVRVHQILIMRILIPLLIEPKEGQKNKIKYSLLKVLPLHPKKKAIHQVRVISSSRICFKRQRKQYKIFLEMMVNYQLDMIDA